MKRLSEEIIKTAGNSKRLIVIGELMPKFIRRHYYNYYLIQSERKAIKGYRKLYPKLEENIAALQKGMDTPEFKKNRFQLFFNNRLFFLLAIRDILTTHEQLLLNRNKNAENILARTLALHLYEFIQDFQKLNGKDFRGELATIPHPENILKQFDQIKQYFHKIKPDYESLLKDIRHHTIAHKDKDALKLQQKISDVDQLKIIEAETLAFLLFSIYDKFLQDTGEHFVKFPKEIASLPYPKN